MFRPWEISSKIKAYVFSVEFRTSGRPRPPSWHGNELSSVFSLLRRDSFFLNPTPSCQQSPNPLACAPAVEIDNRV